MADREDYRIALIEIAERVAQAGVPRAEIMDREDEYLARFRKAYHHLASTVEKAAGLRDTEPFKKAPG